MNEEFMTYHVSDRYKVCPICGTTDDLYVKRTSQYIQSLKCMEYSFSLHCDECNLTFGENREGKQVYGTESELIADWNRRKY